MRLCFIIFFIFTCFTAGVESTCQITAALREGGHILLGEIMPCDYVKEFPPPREKGKAVEVECAIYVQDITSFNAENMDFRIDLIFYMSWEDSRLTLNQSDLVDQGSVSGHLTLSAYALEYLWMPDPYITNSKDASVTSMTTMYASLAIHRNHTLRYSARVYSLISCQMSFKKYPMDVQTCQISFRSFKYTSQRVMLRWRKDEPVTVNPDLQLLQFEVELTRNFAANSSTRDFGGYTNRQVVGLVVEFKFYRLIGHHIVQTYIPSFLMVSLTWFSFWIGLDAIPGRMTLLVTSLLTIVTLFSGINRDIPAVAYVKAIDIWMAGCIFFAFAAMGEFVICKVIKVFHEKHKVIPITDGSRPRSYPLSRNSSMGGSPMFFNSSNHTNNFNNNLHTNNFNNNNHQNNNMNFNFQSNNNNNNFKEDPGHFTSHVSHRNSQHWPPPGDVERGIRSEFSNNRITKINGREIDLSRNVTVVGAAMSSFNGSGDNKRPRDSDARSGVGSSDWDQLVGDRRAKRKKRWIKTIRDLEMQWDDPKTGDTKILWEEIDSTSRILFPCVFFIFAAIYFPLLIML